MVLPKRNKTEVGAWGGGREVMVDRSGRWGSGVDRTGQDILIFMSKIWVRFPV